MKKSAALLWLGFTLSVFAQADRAATIVSVKGSEILIKTEKVDTPFLSGQKLHIPTDAGSVVLEVTFPMQTVARCRLVSGSAAKLCAGMNVYSGALSSAATESTVRKSDGIKIMKEKDESFSLSAAAFALKDACVPEGGIIFPTGTSDDSKAKIEKGFLIAATETTFAQWTAVKIWAEAHGYTFGLNGENGQTKDLDAISESDSMQYPVTRVNWRDCVVWCNALTEYYNAAQVKDTLDCVYYTDASYKTPLRISTAEEKITGSRKGSQDCPYIKAASKGNVSMENCIAKGFRLPASEEWEYAARYRGNDPVNTVDGYKTPYFTKGNSASGALGSYKDKRATNAVAVFEKYDDNSATGVTSTAKVKSKKANALGLYDMSGNIWEWCFDWHEGKTESRMLRGGSFNFYADYTRIGSIFVHSPYYSNLHYRFGFRVARTK